MATLVMPGLYQITMGYVHAYLVEADGELTLVDTGLPGRGQRVLSALSDLGRGKEALRHIVITHHHPDHMGALKELRDATGATVYAHQADAPYIRGEKAPSIPQLTGLARIAAQALGRLMPAASKTAVDWEVQDGDEISPARLRVVHTPGHTPGHICLLWQRHGGVLLVGDAAINVLGLRPPPALFTLDMDQAKESLRRIAGLEFQVACFGHGGILKGKAHVAFRRLVEQLAR
jgi:glyoxylase-like metal-dependent hydrolase (beta-lactamase superfamily II)